MMYFTSCQPCIGDCVEFLGWGQGISSPELIEGRFYVIEDVDVLSDHTKVKIRDCNGWFDAVYFSKLE